MRARSLALSALVILSLIAFTSCQKKKEVETTPTPAPPAPVETAKPPEPVKEVTESFKPETPPAPAPVVEPTIDELNRQGVLRTVYFGYDRSDLSDETRATLQANAAWLKANPKRTVEIAGHCDERGTIEYNIALGERRAISTRDYLVSLGVDASRLSTVTYGEERPADPGHGESAWAKNRRAEFRIKS